MSTSDVPVLWMGNALSRPRNQPLPFRIDLDPGLRMEQGLRFESAIGARADKEVKASPKTSPDLLCAFRLAHASLVLVVVCLGLIVFTQVYVTSRLSASVSMYSEALSPYLGEASSSTMDMLRNAKASSEFLKHMMHQADVLASSSAPTVMQSVNRTASLVDSLHGMVRNPVMRLSFGS